MANTKELIDIVNKILKYNIAIFHKNIHNRLNPETDEAERITEISTFVGAGSKHLTMPDDMKEEYKKCVKALSALPRTDLPPYMSVRIDKPAMTYKGKNMAYKTIIYLKNDCMLYLDSIDEPGKSFAAIRIPVEFEDIKDVKINAIEVDPELKFVEIKGDKCYLAYVDKDHKGGI